MDADEFWCFLERSALETKSPRERTGWLEYRLSRVSETHIVDFQSHLNAARRPIDTYAMWGAAYQIMDGLCGDDGFWYFQPWLIGQGRKWYEHAARDADNLADVPGVRVLSGRPSREWSDAEWPQWEELSYVAVPAGTTSSGRWHRAQGRPVSFLLQATMNRGVLAGMYLCHQPRKGAPP